MSHTISRVYTDNAGLQFVYSETVTLGTAETNINAETIADASANRPILNFSADQSQLKSVMLKSTKNITLYTNDLSSGSPQDTIALVANVPKQWSLVADGIGACPFSADVDSLYASNASGGAAILDIRITFDPIA
jgi:hypothetical protein